MKLSFFIFFFLSLVASAETPFLKNVEKADLIGYWRVMSIPDELNKSQFKNKDIGYEHPCRFFIMNADGIFINISQTYPLLKEQTRQDCNATKKYIDSAIFATTAHQPAIGRWFFVPGNKDGIFVIEEASVKDLSKNNKLLWAAQYIMEDKASASTVGFDLKKGDLNLLLLNSKDLKNLKPIWSMVLRPVTD